MTPNGFVFLVVWISSHCLQTRAIYADVNVIASYVERLINDTLGVSLVQESVNKLHFGHRKVDGHTFVTNLSEEISTAITSRVNAAIRLRDSVESSLAESFGNEWTPCCRYSKNSLRNNSNYKTKVDLHELCEVIAPTSPTTFQSLSVKVLEQMQRNQKMIPDIKWQYVGSDQGILSLYPALRLTECGKTDPRNRPWYVETASPKPKNILFLLDNSHSMLKTFNSKRLINISTSAISSTLETMTPKDRIGLVAFNNVAMRPEGCFQTELAPATRNNIKALNQNFLSHLNPRGESFYSVGFKNAFDLIYSTKQKVTSLEPADWVILFITDGKPKEMYGRLPEVYNAIHRGNAKLNNTVTIHTYGLGMDVNMTMLEEISSQNFSLTNNTMDLKSKSRSGTSFRITDPFYLRERLSSFYSSNIITNQTKPTFSVPYVDTGGLGLIFTVGLPAFWPNNKGLFGVVAVDITLQEVFTDAYYLDNGEDSYVFVVDGTGLVITHPLMPRPSNVSDHPKFVQIHELERHAGVKDIIESMKAGHRGNKTLIVKQVLPVGDSVQTTQINATYFWRPIRGTNFSICFVMELGKNDLILRPQDVASIVHANTSFRYHRLDLGNDKDVCRHFYHKSTVSQSTVLFAPRCFRSPIRYQLTEETDSTLRQYQQFFNSLLAATTVEQVTRILTDQKDVADLFAPGVIADVMWTSFVDHIWINRSDNHVALRFVGTATGVDRVFPGTRLQSDFDVTKRLWYELALSNPKEVVFSTPYKDAAGAGNVISISKAILTPLHRKKRDIVGVMGVDFSLNYLYSMLSELYPYCKRKLNSSPAWNCVLVDDGGNIILHEKYLDNNEQNQLRLKHIASDRNLMNKLLELKLVRRMSCFDLDTEMYRNWYKIEPYAQLNDTLFARNLQCSQYFMKSVPGTNVFFLARPFIPWCGDFGCSSLQEPQCKNQTWKCPCTRDVVDRDTCVNQILIDPAVPSCYPPRPKLLSLNECIPDYLARCIDPQCEFANQTNCSSLVGCVWCHQTSTGSSLASPHCSASDKCFNGLQGQRLPDYENTPNCLDEQRGTSSVILLAVAICGSIALIALMTITICCYKKIKRQKHLIEENEKGVCDDDSDPPPTDKAPCSPSISQKGHKVTGYKHSVPQVILSVLDTDGSEIIRKPVQLVKGGVTYGGSTTNNLRPLHETDTANKPSTINKKRKNKKSNSTSSSNNKSDLEQASKDENERQRSSSFISQNSSDLLRSPLWRRRDVAPELLQTRNSRKRAETEPSSNIQKWEEGNPGYLPTRSVSSHDISLTSDSLLNTTKPLRWNSSDNIQRYSVVAKDACKIPYHLRNISRNTAKMPYANSKPIEEHVGENENSDKRFHVYL